MRSKPTPNPFTQQFNKVCYLFASNRFPQASSVLTPLIDSLLHSLSLARCQSDISLLSRYLSTCYANKALMDNGDSNPALLYNPFNYIVYFNEFSLHYQRGQFEMALATIVCAISCLRLSLALLLEDPDAQQQQLLLVTQYCQTCVEAHILRVLMQMQRGRVRLALNSLATLTKLDASAEYKTVRKIIGAGERKGLREGVKIMEGMLGKCKGKRMQSSYYCMDRAMGEDIDSKLEEYNRVFELVNMYGTECGLFNYTAVKKVSNNHQSVHLATNTIKDQEKFSLNVGKNNANSRSTGVSGGNSVFSASNNNSSVFSASKNTSSVVSKNSSIVSKNSSIFVNSNSSSLRKQSIFKDEIRESSPVRSPRTPRKVYKRSNSGLLSNRTPFLEENLLSDYTVQPKSYKPLALVEAVIMCQLYPLSMAYGEVTVLYAYHNCPIDSERCFYCVVSYNADSIDGTEIKSVRAIGREDVRGQMKYGCEWNDKIGFVRLTKEPSLLSITLLKSIAGSRIPQVVGKCCTTLMQSGTFIEKLKKQEEIVGEIAFKIGRVGGFKKKNTDYMKKSY